MAERATLFIPDISGFTEFTSAVEIDHAAHIINELLELIVDSNELGFVLAEIEGDAVLFYLKGEHTSSKELTRQCLLMFRNFHQRLIVIERDTVCQCGACQSATNLSLKFIIHHGEIKEIKVAHFIKATGLDMILAHRLLKNSIKSNEYILITRQCLECSQDELPNQVLSWNKSSQNYAAIGNVEFKFATLQSYRKEIPEPPNRKEYVILKGDDNLEVNIEKPLMDVYQTLINIDERKNWMLGVDKINRDPVTERIGMKHNCQFMGMTMVNTCLHAEYSENKATYIEQVQVLEIGLDVDDIYTLNLTGEQNTNLQLNLNWKETVLPEENKQGMLKGIMANLESMKVYLENK